MPLIGKKEEKTEKKYSLNMNIGTALAGIEFVIDLKNGNRRAEFYPRCAFHKDSDIKEVLDFLAENFASRLKSREGQFLRADSETQKDYIRCEKKLHEMYFALKYEQEAFKYA